MAPSAKPVIVSSKKLLNRNAKFIAIPFRPRAAAAAGSTPGRSRLRRTTWTRSLDGRRVRGVELPVRDLVGEDRGLLDVAVGVERDRTAHAVAGVAADEGVHVRVAGLPGVEPGEEDVRRVERLGGVQTRGAAV